MMCRREIETQIVQAVARLQRQYGAVYPWQVGPWLDEYRHEATLRRYMARMAADGALIRVGGFDRRKGYRVERTQHAS